MCSVKVLTKLNVIKVWIYNDSVNRFKNNFGNSQLLISASWSEQPACPFSPSSGVGTGIGTVLARWKLILFRISKRNMTIFRKFLQFLFPDSLGLGYLQNFENRIKIAIRRASWICGPFSRRVLADTGHWCLASNKTKNKLKCASEF